jgi:hypothetical protein
MKAFKKTLLAVVVCLAVGLLISAPVTAKTVVTKVEYSFTTSNPCTGAEMLINFQVHTVSQLADNDNRINSKYIQTTKIDAVDADGNIYSGKESISSKFNASKDPGQLVSTFSDKITLKSDAAPDITFTSTFRTVVNAKGEVVVSVSDFEQECTP